MFLHSQSLISLVVWGGMDAAVYHMPDPNIGEISATVWEHKIGKKPTDVIFTSRAFFFSMGDDGFKEEVNGGRVFELGQEYAENTNFHSYGEMDQLDTTRINVFDALRFDQKICAGTVVISELERLRAEVAAVGAGKYPLLEEKLENGKDSHIADMNRQMLGSASSGTDIGGVQFIISTTPTTGSVGGVNRATFTFHRNRQTSGAQSVSAYDNLRASWTTIYNQCSLGGVKNVPRWVCTDRPSMQGYEQILVAIEQLADAKMKADSDIAFANDMLKFKGAKVYYDEDSVAGNAYFYNNVNLKVAYLKGGWMKMYPPRDPHNQLANTHKVMTVLNLVTNGSRHLGVVSAIT